MEPQTILIVAIVCVAVGYIAGLLIGAMRKDGSKEKRSAVAATPTAQAGSAEASGERENLAQLFRPAPGGSMGVQIGEQSWADVTQVPDAQRAALEGLLGEFRRWLKPLETPAPVAVPAEPLPASPVFVTTPAQPSQPAVYKPPFIEAKTIVAQIDEILQEMLVNGPMAERKIRLLEMPNQGVVVRVGLDQYPGIEAVPDPEIRNLIRQAVSTWEAKAV
jgi:hypothetical protein